MATCQNILVMLPNWVGDAVMFTPALRALRGHYPDARIVLAGRPGPAATLEPNPWQAEVVVDSGGLAALAGRLRVERFDLAVLGPNSFRSALVAFLAGARMRVGYNRDGRRLLLTRRLSPPRTSAGKLAVTPALDYYLQLVAFLGCTVLGKQMELSVAPADRDRAGSLLARAGCSMNAQPRQGPQGPGKAVPPEYAQAEKAVLPEHAQAGKPVAPENAQPGKAVPPRPLVMLNPGASFGPSKMYPPERFAAVADELARAKGAQIVINAGPGEAPIADAVVAAMKEPVLLNLAKEPNSIGLVKALVERCDLLITNDTGPRHFAAALGRPLVTIFGSTDPAWTTIYYASERIVRADVPCAPCQKKICREEGSKRHTCMLSIEPALVVEAALELLEAGTA